MKRTIWLGLLCTAAGCSSGPNPTETDVWWGVDGQPFNPEPTEFCDWDPVRSDALLLFSDALQLEEGTEYEISISGDLENFESDFAYPDPLVCTIRIQDGERNGSYPGYTPTDEEFTFDSVPRWEFDEDDQEILAFRWYRVATSVDVILSRNGEEVFADTASLTVETSECEEHVFTGFEDHPEHGESYRNASATIDTSE